MNENNVHNARFTKFHKRQYSGRFVQLLLINLFWLKCRNFESRLGERDDKYPKHVKTHVHVKNLFVLRTSPNHVSITQNQNGAKAKIGSIRRESLLKKYSFLSDVMRWRSCSIVQRGCVSWSHPWPPRRDKCSSVLMAGGTGRPDWSRARSPTRVTIRDP